MGGIRKFPDNLNLDKVSCHSSPGVAETKEYKFYFGKTDQNFKNTPPFELRMKEKVTYEQKSCSDNIYSKALGSIVEKLKMQKIQKTAENQDTMFEEKKI